MAAPTQSPQAKSALVFPKGQDDMSPRFNIRLVPYSFTSNFQGGIQDNVSQSIYLPMPTNGLIDNYSIDFDPQAMGAIGGTAGAITNVLNGQGDAGALGWNALMALGRQAGLSGVQALGDTFLGDTGSVLKGGYEMAVGNIINPNYAILFQGVKPRQFNFTWRMTARNREESKTIYDIIYALKKNALPSKNSTSSTYLLQYPAIAYIGLYGPNKDNENTLSSIYMTFSNKGSYINGININYNGSSSHVAVFKENNAPVQIDLTLSFMERSIITSDDISSTLKI